MLICHDEAAQQQALRAVADAVETGRLSEARVRVSCERIAKVKARYLRRTRAVSAEEITAVVGCDAHRRLAERVAQLPS